MDRKTIGKIVRSNSHTDYVCQVYRQGEVAEPPTPVDYAFGTFVRIACESAPPSWLIGVVYNTILMNPEFGNLGPRLSPEPDLQVFSPDYLSEKVTLVGILALGMLNAGGKVDQGVPRLAAVVDALVEQVSEQELRAFHQKNASLLLGYVPRLVAEPSPLIPHLLLDIVSKVEAVLPEHSAQLVVLRNTLAWKTFIQPLG